MSVLLVLVAVRMSSVANPEVVRSIHDLMVGSQRLPSMGNRRTWMRLPSRRSTYPDRLFA
jgi:hypothetical protein